MTSDSSPITHFSGVVEVLDIATYPNAAAVMTCGHCHRSWDDSVVTAWTPVPSARCPFEYEHINGE